MTRDAFTTDDAPRRPVHRVAAFPQALAPTGGPILVQGPCRWPVFDLVTSGGLVDRFGDVTLVARCPDRADPWRPTVREYLAYCDAPGANNGWYAKEWVVTALMDLFVGGPLPGAFGSWLDLLPPSHRPPWSWLFVGPTGSTSRLHVDTMCSSAWNVLVSGRKRWLLMSPAVSARAGLLEPDVAEVLDPDQYAVEVDQVPGDCLVVPAGWAHSVANLTTTIALTGNFVNASNIGAVRAHHRAAGRANWLDLLDKLQRQLSATQPS